MCVVGDYWHRRKPSCFFEFCQLMQYLLPVCIWTIHDLWQALCILLPTWLRPTCPKTSRSTDGIARFGGHSVLDFVAALYISFSLDYLPSTCFSSSVKCPLGFSGFYSETCSSTKLMAWSSSPRILSSVYRKSKEWELYGILLVSSRWNYRDARNKSNVFHHLLRGGGESSRQISGELQHSVNEWQHA